MKKIYNIFEYAWLVAAIASFGTGLFNLIRFSSILNTASYFPLLIGVMCTIVYLMIRNHRRFLEKQEKQVQQ